MSYRWTALSQPSATLRHQLDGASMRFRSLLNAPKAYGSVSCDSSELYFLGSPACFSNKKVFGQKPCFDPCLRMNKPTAVLVLLLSALPNSTSDDFLGRLPSSDCYKVTNGAALLQTAATVQIPFSSLGIIFLPFEKSRLISEEFVA